MLRRRDDGPRGQPGRFTSDLSNFYVGEIGSYDRGMAHRYPHLLKVNISSISMQSTIAVR